MYMVIARLVSNERQGGTFVAVITYLSQTLSLAGFLDHIFLAHTSLGFSNCYYSKSLLLEVRSAAACCSLRLFGLPQ